MLRDDKNTSNIINPHEWAVLPKNSKWLIKRMKALGHKANPNGVCFGLIGMFQQALYANDLDKFFQRLSYINSIPENEIKERIDRFRARKAKLAAAKSNEGRETLLDQPNKDDEFLSEIPAFFEGIELYLNDRNYTHLYSAPLSFPQDALATSTLVMPNSLKEKNLSLRIPESFSGIYNLQELQDYFHSLQNAISDLSTPFSMTLLSSNHAISVAYENGKWLFTDPKTLPSKVIDGNDINSIAKLVLKSLSKNDNACFRTNVLALNSNEKNIKKRINRWKQEPSWKKIHQVSESKLKMTDSRGTSWLHAAAAGGQLSTVEKLLKAKANVNQTLLDEASSPLSIAIQNGHTQVVKVLLKNKANIEQRVKGVSPLTVAALFAPHEIVKLLLANGADVNQGHDGNTPNVPEEQRGYTPLFAAIQENREVEIIKLLLANGADPEKGTHSSSKDCNPLFVAAKLGQIKTVKALVKYGAKTSILSDNIGEISDVKVLSFYHHHLKKEGKAKTYKGHVFGRADTVQKHYAALEKELWNRLSGISQPDGFLNRRFISKEAKKAANEILRVLIENKESKDKSIEQKYQDIYKVLLKHKALLDKNSRFNLMGNPLRAINMALLNIRKPLRKAKSGSVGSIYKVDNNRENTTKEALAAYIAEYAIDRMVDIKRALDEKPNDLYHSPQALYDFLVAERSKLINEQQPRTLFNENVEFLGSGMTRKGPDVKDYKRYKVLGEVLLEFERVAKELGVEVISEITLIPTIK